MAHIDNKIQVLLQRYMEGLASVSEYEELVALLAIELDSPAVEQVLLQQVKAGTYHPAGESVDWSFMLQSILKQQAVEGTGARQGLPGGAVRRMPWIGWVAAAVVLFLVCGLWFLVGRNGGEKPSVAVAPKVEQDVAPGGDKAILTLADGSQVVLDTASNGAITKQGSVTVIKLNGKLAYQSATSSATAAVTYNTITTPRGGQYQLELADGSKVWLNAASSLRFPTAFSGKERRVELTGEGYFEVAHNASQPFIVGIPPSGGNKEGMDVQVLGTHFNINAYSDEPSIRTTLLEGRVLVKKNDKHVYLNPGQQAILQPGQDDIRVNYEVNVKEVVAWKNGRFFFNNVDIETVMRQVARWYDVKVVYGGKISETISGGISRSENISQLLKTLEATGKVDFTISGKQIIVQPTK